MKATTQLPLIVGLPLIGIPSLATLAPAPHSRRGFFVRGRGHGNPQEFFGKRNFALLIVVYRSPFGIVRESVPSPGRLPPAPPLAGLFCLSIRLRSWWHKGASRDEIAALFGVTVGSLQVTCSRLGISLRRKILHSGPSPHLRDPKGTVISFQESAGVAYERKQKAAEVLPARSTKISIIMRYRGKEVPTDLPLTSHALGELALIAMLRDLSIPELVGQILAGAINKDMIKEVSRGAT